GNDARHRDPRAEALCLQQRVARQLGAGYAGRKSEVVLDTRARPGLAAGREAFEDHDVQSLGSAVDRRGEPSRAGAYNDQVMHLRRIQRDIESRAVRKLLDRRTSKKPAFAADDYRRVRGGNAELTKQFLGVRIAFQVDPSERNRIPSREVAKAMRI